jgi:hypothetical protein
VSATLLPIPSGTWTREGKPIDVLAMWVDSDRDAHDVAVLIRYPDSGQLAATSAGWLRLARPDPATTLDGVLEQLDALRESTAWAPAGDPLGKAHRELARIIEAARAGA